MDQGGFIYAESTLIREKVTQEGQSTSIPFANASYGTRTRPRVAVSVLAYNTAVYESLKQLRYIAARVTVLTDRFI